MIRHVCLANKHCADVCVPSKTVGKLVLGAIASTNITYRRRSGMDRGIIGYGKRSYDNHVPIHVA